MANYYITGRSRLPRIFFQEISKTAARKMIKEKRKTVRDKEKYKNGSRRYFIYIYNFFISRQFSHYVQYIL